MRLPLLALLARGPAHGYELKQDLEQLLGAAYPQPNVGQIYVTLGRLEKSGLIEGEDVEQSSRPNKKVYHLTEAGREALRHWFEETEAEPRVRDEFFMKLALAPADRSRRPDRPSSTSSGASTSTPCATCRNWPRPRAGTTESPSC